MPGPTPLRSSGLDPPIGTDVQLIQFDYLWLQSFPSGFAGTTGAAVASSAPGVVTDSEWIRRIWLLPVRIRCDRGGDGIGLDYLIVVATRSPIRRLPAFPYQVEVSSDLVHWSYEGVEILSRKRGEGSWMITVRDARPWGPRCIGSSGFGGPVARRNLKIPDRGHFEIKGAAWGSDLLSPVPSFREPAGRRFLLASAWLTRWIEVLIPGTAPKGSRRNRDSGISPPSMPSGSPGSSDVCRCVRVHGGTGPCLIPCPTRIPMRESK